MIQEGPYYLIVQCEIMDTKIVFKMQNGKTWIATLHEEDLRGNSSFCQGTIYMFWNPNEKTLTFSEEFELSESLKS